MAYLYEKENHHWVTCRRPLKSVVLVFSQCILRLSACLIF